MSFDRAALIQFLQKVAARQAAITYGEVAQRIGPDMGMPHHCREMGAILVDISEDEYRPGRPLLSAVVVASDSHTPVLGFFGLAKWLRLLGTGDRDTLFIAELRRAHAFWPS